MGTVFPVTSIGIYSVDADMLMLSYSFKLISFFEGIFPRFSRDIFEIFWERSLSDIFSDTSREGVGCVQQATVGEMHRGFKAEYVLGALARLMF